MVRGVKIIDAETYDEVIHMINEIRENNHDALSRLIDGCMKCPTFKGFDCYCESVGSDCHSMEWGDSRGVGVELTSDT